MVVDNEFISSQTHPLCSPLLECGYQVTHTNKPYEALKQLKLASNGNAHYAPALLICDLFLDNMDGLDFVQELRQMQKASGQVFPILLVATIESNPTFEQAVLNMGADDFIVKPVRTSDLLLRVRRLLRGLPGVIVEQLENTRIEAKRGKELEGHRLEEEESPFRALRGSPFDFD